MSSFQLGLFLLAALHGRLATDCKAENVHITLGDYFVDKKSEIVYRVGFMARDESCRRVELRVTYPDGSNPQIFEYPIIRPYSFNDTYSVWGKDIKIEYFRTFYFMELSGLHNYEKFDYQFWLMGHPVSRKFHFSSKVYSGQTPLKIVAFGDHDHAEEGMKTIQRLEKTDYDLLIHLGDFAYEIYTDNGNWGDKYFEAMETAITKAPFVMTPGNHENIDNTLFLNTRFFMPGTKQPLDNNWYTFEVADTLFMSFNFDVILEIFPDVDNHKQIVQKLFTHRRAESSAKWTAFFSHRPTYCSTYNVPYVGCPSSPYYLKFYEDLLESLGTQIYLFGHIHTYERYSHMHDLEIQEGPDKLYIISGSAGNAQFFKKVDPFKIQFLKKYIAGIPGVSVLEKTKSGFDFSFMKSETGEILDTATLSLQKSSKTVQIIFLVIFAILASVVLSLVFTRKPKPKAPSFRDIQEEMERDNHSGILV